MDIYLFFTVNGNKISDNSGGRISQRGAFLAPPGSSK